VVTELDASLNSSTLRYFPISAVVTALSAISEDKIDEDRFNLE
jgi:hypothetical protein